MGAPSRQEKRDGCRREAHAGVGGLCLCCDLVEIEDFLGNLYENMRSKLAISSDAVFDHYIHRHLMDQNKLKTDK